MIDIKNLKQNLDVWKTGLARKGYKGDLGKLTNLADQVAEMQAKVEELNAEKNKAAKAQDREMGEKVKKQLATAESKLSPLQLELDELTLAIPNLPQADVPDGGEDDAKEIGKFGEPTKIDKPRDHVELGNMLQIIDTERGAKVSGARFYYLKNEAVELEWALVNWVMKLLKDKGFEFLWTPTLLNERAMMAAGYLGKAKDEIYKTQDDLYLIGTSEASVLAYHMDEIITVPKRYAAFTPCFRREAGSYGKDVKGIIRTHQFDKVEMFSFVAPENSATEHEMLVAIEEEIVKGLEIPYRKVLLAAGDISAASSKTYDLESWLPSQKKYRETHSTSNCTDWQARRANVRYKDEAGKSQYVHTLNATAIAIGRMLVAILENHQQPDGSVNVPKVLHKYLDFTEIKLK